MFKQGKVESPKIFAIKNEIRFTKQLICGFMSANLLKEGLDFGI